MSESATTLLLVVGISLLPLFLVIASSFAKIAIVLTILRNAIGAQGIPPNLVITALAALLTAFIMAPVAHSAMSESRPILEPVLAAPDGQAVPADTRVHVYALALERAAEPVRGFLESNSRPDDRRAFVELARGLRGAKGAPVGERDVLVLAPAFVTSELREAFLIGIAVLIPFLIIDLVVANTLVVLGLSSVPVPTIALPLKLSLFVVVDGWQLLLQGLIAGYQV